MTERIAFVFPGQGSQKPGMASEWLPYAAAMFEDWSDAADLDLVEVADDAKRIAGSTRLQQPSIAAVSLAAAAALADAGIRPDLVAGHSLGELTAATVAGVFTPSEGVALAAARGRAMGEACRVNPGTMGAAVHVDRTEVESIVDGIDGVVLANLNAEDQTVIAGTEEAVAAAGVAVKEAGGRLVPLSVEGAFHSPAMEPAMAALETALGWIPSRDPRFPILSAIDTEPRTTGETVRSALLDGVLAPVRWIDVEHRLVDEGVGLALEVGPGGVLTKLIHRGAREIEVVQVATPADVPAAAEAVARHRGVEIDITAVEDELALVD